MANSMREPSERVRFSSNLPRRREVSKMLRAGTQTQRITSAPASARALAMAQPKPWSSATPAMKAFLPVRSIERPARAATEARVAPLEPVEEAAKEVGAAETPDRRGVAARPRAWVVRVAASGQRGRKGVIIRIE